MHDLLLSCPQALLAEERRCGRAREARHKLELERLRQQLREAQDSNGELRGQVQHLEAQRLSQSWGGAAATAAAGTAEAAEGPAGSGSRRGSAGGSSGVPAAHAAARNAAGRWGQAGNGLPAVRVERGSSSSGGSSSGRVGSMRAPPASASEPNGEKQRMRQQQELQQACWQDAAGEEEGDEQFIADVELLSDEEVVVCEQEQEEEEEAADSPPLGSMPGSAPSGVAPVQHTDQPQQAQQQPALGAGAPQEAPTDAVSKASSALARLNQLRSSLAQREGLQSRLGSRAGSPQASPLPVAALQPVDSAAPTVDDDLRRLGRSLLATAGPAASSTAPAVQLAAPAPPPAPGSPRDPIVSELQHPDGSWERLFASGLREQRFGNGSTKLQLPGAGGAGGVSGASLTRFANGDAKKALPCGAVEYFYAAVNSWQVTHPSGAEVYFFPSGQVGELWVARWVGGGGWRRVEEGGGKGGGKGGGGRRKGTSFTARWASSLHCSRTAGVHSHLPAV